MKILDTYIIAGDQEWLVALVALFFALFFAVLIPIAIGIKVNKEKYNVLWCFLGAIIFSIIFSVFYYGFDVCEDKTMHHAIYSKDSDMSIQEFYENYRVISKEGNIFVLQDKNRE